MKALLVISVIPPENEGRLKKTLGLLGEVYQVTLVSPQTEYDVNNVKRICVCKKRPIGIKEQFAFSLQVQKCKIIKKQHYDAIYIANFLAIPSAILLCSKLKVKKVIYDAYEILFQNRNKKLKYKNRIYLLMEKWAMKNSDLIIETNYERAILAQGYYLLEKLPTILSNFNCIVANEVIKHTEYRNKNIKVCYLGYISVERKLPELIKQIVCQNNIQLDIYGYGSDLDIILDLMEQLNATNVTFRGKYNLEQLENIVKQYDMGYINYATDVYNSEYCEPNKIYEYAAYGIPMIGFEHPKLKKVFNEYKIGISSNNIVESIFEIKENNDLYRKNSRHFYECSMNNTYIENKMFMVAVSEVLEEYKC